MQGNGLPVGVAVVEVLALEDARHVELAHELEHLGEVKGLKPVAVVDDGGLLGVQDLHGLRHVGLGIGLDLLLRERRAGGVTAGRVADKGGTVADDERDLVAQVLELAHLAQGDCVSKVKVRAGGIHAQLDVKRHPALKLLAKLVHGHDLHGARRDDLQLFFDWQQSSVLRVSSYVFADRTRGRARTRIAQVEHFST